MKTGTERIHQGQQELPVKVGDKVSLKVSCECIDAKDFVCPFESDCEFDECSDGNERVVTSTIKSIWDEGQGWFFSVEGLNIDIPMTDIGKSVMLVEAAGEKVKMSAEEAIREPECAKNRLMQSNHMDNNRMTAFNIARNALEKQILEVRKIRLIDADRLKSELSEAVQKNGDMDCLDFYRVATLIDSQTTVYGIDEGKENDRE